MSSPAAVPVSNDNSPIELTPANVGLAFGLVLAAGLSTTVGASAVFFFRHTNLKMLAASLGVSAGVMLYVSFVEIFATKSVQGFLDAGHEVQVARRYATLCFFGGMVVIWLLDKVVHIILHFASHGMKALDLIRIGKKKRRAEGTAPSESVDASIHSSDVEEQAPPPALAHPHCGCHSVSELLAGGAAPTGTPRAIDAVANGGHAVTAAAGSGAAGNDGPALPAQTQPDRAIEGDQVVAVALQADASGSGLSRMGLLAALAIGIHNLPEGLATFVGTLADPTAGVVIAVAIALHNIPEGVVVAMPIYYASGSKWKGFTWGVLSGVTEPIGALVGYAALRGQDMDPMVYALMFGLVGGMMVYISLTELLPTALKYDPDDSVTTWAVVIGMLVMAASLLLFGI